MKKFLWTCLVILLSLVGYFVYDNRVGFQNLLRDKFDMTIGDKEMEENELSKNESYQRYLDSEKKHLRFAGQIIHYVGTDIDTNKSAFLIKGKLLDKSYKELYDKIPDTLDLDFATDLYFVEESSATPYQPQAQFAFRPEYDVDTLKINLHGQDYELRSMLDRLIYEGKAEGHHIYPAKFASSKYIYPYELFGNKYSDYFSSSSHFLFEELDYDIKELLLEFLNSEEGKNFGYPDDQRTYRELICVDNYTASGQDELAVVLHDKERIKTGGNKEVLLIIAYDNEKQCYYTLYKKFFYDKIVIKEIFYNTETCYYQGAHLGDDPNPPYYSLLLKLPDEPERILHYDSEFDNMKEINVADLKMNSRMLRLFLIWITVVVLTLLQGLVALWNQLDNIASSTVQGGLEFDLLISGGMLGIAVTVILFLLDKLRCTQILKIAMSFTLLCMGWIWLNTMLFDDYEASWSTYSRQELWISGVSISLLPVSVSAMLWLGILYLLDKKIKLTK